MRKLHKTFYLFVLLLFCGLFWTEGWANSSHERSRDSKFSCSPVPPPHFFAVIKKKPCAKKNITHILTWKPSPDPKVIKYKVFQDDELIKKTRKHRVVLHHRHKISYNYKLVAIDSSGRESAPLLLRVVPQKSCRQCIKCPQFAVIPPSISTGEVGVFFSQNFTTDKCVNNPIFSTNSMLPAGLKLFPNGVLSGTPTQSGTFPIIVTATKAHGCTAQSPVYNLNIHCAVIAFTTTIVNVCNSMSVPPHIGSITINASGGTGSFIYSIDGGSTFQSSNIFSNLSANTYFVVVKDSNGCTSSGKATVNASNINLDASIGLCNNGFCTIMLIVSGGTSPYTFTMTPIGGGIPISNQNGIFTNLTCGVTYTTEVIDSNGCSATAGDVQCGE